METESDNDNVNTSKIEPTKAEAEAIERGLQVHLCFYILIINVFMTNPYEFLHLYNLL